MSPDIALSLVAQTSTITEKPTPTQAANKPKPTNSHQTTHNHPPTTPQSTFSLPSLKSFFTLPSPTTTPAKKMPALLMLATTALLLTYTSNIHLIPQANASPIAIPSHPEMNNTTTSLKTTHSNPNPGPIPWDTPCPHPSEEGIWNCMATTWQRCVQGRWSVVMRSGDSGTVCVPGGIGRDVKFVSSSQGQGQGGDGGEGAEQQGGGEVGGGGGGGGDQAKWGGRGGWNGGGGYWSGVEGGGVGGKRVVVVLGVAGVVGVVLGGWV